MRCLVNRKADFLRWLDEGLGVFELGHCTEEQRSVGGLNSLSEGFGDLRKVQKNMVEKAKECYYCYYYFIIK